MLDSCSHLCFHSSVSSHKVGSCWRCVVCWLCLQVATYQERLRFAEQEAAQAQSAAAEKTKTAKEVRQEVTNTHSLLPCWMMMCTRQQFLLLAVLLSSARLYAACLSGSCCYRPQHSSPPNINGSCCCLHTLTRPSECVTVTTHMACKQWKQAFTSLVLYPEYACTPHPAATTAALLLHYLFFRLSLS